MRLFAFLLALSLVSPAAAKRREVEDTITLNGKKTQRWRGFHANGKRWYVHYWRNHKKVGVHRDFDAQGRPSREATYRRDVLQGPFKSWHANGKLATRGQHLDGAKNGLFEAFHPDGTPAERRSYRDTLPDGPYRAWHANGQKRFEGRHEAGQPVGVWRHWSAAGRLLAERRFESGAWVEPSAPARETGGLTDAADFRMFLITGGAHEGYDFQVWIHPNGAVDVLRLRLVPRVAKKRAGSLKKGTFYYDTRAWHSRLWLTDADWAALAKQLQRLGPYELPDKVINPDVHDGTQWHFGIRANGKTHRVYCSNDFPPALTRFGSWLRARLASEDYAFEHLTARVAGKERTWRRRFGFDF